MEREREREREREKKGEQRVYSLDSPPFENDRNSSSSYSMQSTYYATYTGCNFLYSLNGDGYKKEEGQKEEEGEEEGETSQRKKIKNTGKKKIGISFED